MLKNKEFWIGFLIAIVLFVAVGEVKKSNTREKALADLNSRYSTITNPAARNALLIKTNTIFAQNRPLFSRTTSSANVPGDDTSYGDNCEPLSTDWVCNLRNDEGDDSVSDSSEWQWIESEGSTSSNWKVKCVPGVTEC